ncbi:MAG: hypothetical protein GQ574_10110 [Crocinitomix sp.]|nr:hypothetical protein [Crocinitomix sp.]
MNRITSFLFVSLLIVWGCEKSTLETPANISENNVGLDCATCPSVLHPFASVEPGGTIITCDNFQGAPWPEDGSFSGGAIVGYTQEGTQPVTVLGDGTCDFGVQPGMYLFGMTQFAFDGSEQIARFNIYAFDGAFETSGFTVNDEEYTPYGDFFPMVLGGVTIDLDYSAPDDDTWIHAYLTFTGNLTEVRLNGFESGTTELCVTKTIEPGVPTIDKSHYIYFDDFYNHSGESVGYHPNYKTPLGYFGYQGTNVVIDFEAFLGYAPTRLSFVHAYLTGSDNLINVQLPNTPLIVTIPDSLEYYLAPYGYTVEYYEDTDGLQWQNATDPPYSDAFVDSIVISGSEMNQVTLGAILQESELRSICTYYEQ